MKCKNQGCENVASLKSKKGYCVACGKLAHSAWLNLVRASAETRDNRNKEFEDLIARAEQAGMAAGNACVPTPMNVVSHANPLDDSSAVEKVYHVPEGVCGFAWINVNPGNCPLANWLKKNRGARKDYYGGVSVWIGEFGQSMTRKEAYADAYAKVLTDAGALESVLQIEDGLKKFESLMLRIHLK